MYPHTSFSATCARARSLARRAALACTLGAALVVTLIAARPACAALGGAPMPTPAGASATTLSAAAAAAATQGNASAVTTQAMQHAASATPATSAAYTVQQTTLANGTVVREYLSQGGTVFGVAWSGPLPPDLATLLGGYFPQYVAAVKASHAAGRARGPAVVEQSGLIVHAGGHMGAFSGQAWLPQALPAGVSASDIH